MKDKSQVISFIGVVFLALILPGVLKVSNGIVRYFVGAEGRLAAINVETYRSLGPLPQPWRALAQGGDELKTFLDSDPGRVAAIKPEVIRIDHIYDQFGIVSKNGDVLVFNWTELDKLVNQIASVGATPFFSLSYMPQAIASGDIISEPKNWNEWSTVVQKTIEHYSGEMKLDDVYYEVWNEPDLFGGWKMGGKKDYKNLYMYASAGAQKARGTRPFKFGGVATTGLYKNWIDVFFPFVLQNKLRLDFFSWHRYDADIFQYAEDVQNVDGWIDRHPYFASVEKIVSEFAADNKQGGANDTMEGAAHLVSVNRELMGRVKYGMNFSVTGQWGIIGKPRYEALKVLASLGGQRLGLTGEGSWVRAIAAREGKSYQVLLTNYDPKGRHSEVVPVNFLNIEGSTFTVKTSLLGGPTNTIKVATSGGVLQQKVLMNPNSVVLVQVEVTSLK